MLSGDIMQKDRMTFGDDVQGGATTTTFFTAVSRHGRHDQCSLANGVGCRPTLLFG